MQWEMEVPVISLTCKGWVSGLSVCKHTLQVLGSEKRPGSQGSQRRGRPGGGAPACGAGQARVTASRRAPRLHCGGASSESRAGRQRRGVEAAAAPELGGAAAPPRAVPGSAGR